MSAVTKFFYDYHLAKFDGKKMRLTAKIREFGTDPVQGPLKEIDRSHLTSFDAQFSYYARKSIRIVTRTAKETPGPDTHFSLEPDAPPVATAGQRKRKYHPIADGALGGATMPNHPGGMPPYGVPGGPPPPGHAGLQGVPPTHHVGPQQHYQSSYQQQHLRQPQFPNGHTQHAHHAQHAHQASIRPAEGVSSAALLPKAEPPPQQQQGVPPPSPIVSGAAGAPVRRNASHAPGRGVAAAPQCASPAKKRARTARAADGNARPARASPSRGTAKGNSPVGGDRVVNVDSNSGEEEEDDLPKEYYQSLCDKLTAKLNKKKDVERENRRLKGEIVQLKSEVERLRGLVEPSTVSLE